MKDLNILKAQIPPPKQQPRYEEMDDNTVNIGTTEVNLVLKSQDTCMLLNKAVTARI